MLPLPPELLAAQRARSHIPALTVRLNRELAGLPALPFTRIHGGGAAAPHAVTGTDAGSLVRARVVAGTLEAQRVPDPGPDSDFTAWTPLSPAAAVAPALAAGPGGHVALAAVQADGVTVTVRESGDDGATFGDPTPVAVGGAPVTGVALAESGAGDLLLAYVQLQTVWASRRPADGGWGPPQAWPFFVDTVDSIALSHGGDYQLFVAGAAAAGPRVWGVEFGDGWNYPPGQWGPLHPIAAADAGAGVSFHAVTGRKSLAYRAAWIRRDSGPGGTDRIYHSHMPPLREPLVPLWREPAPLAAEPGAGPALAAAATHWLDTGTELRLEPPRRPDLALEDDVLDLAATQDRDGGTLRLQLRNDHGRYAPGTPAGDRLAPGAQVLVSFGYRTPDGPRYGVTAGYWLHRVERTAGDGRAAVTLEGHDGWGLLAAWRAPEQLEWAQGSTRLFDILQTLVARAAGFFTSWGGPGRTSSQAILDLKPAFTVYPGERGDTAVRRLVAMVPDELGFTQDIAFTAEPDPAEAPSYTYGTDHPILAATFRDAAEPWNAVTAFGEGVLGEAFLTDSIARTGLRLRQVHDRTVTAAADAAGLAAAALAAARRAAAADELTVPPNAGQELADVVAVEAPHVLPGESRVRRVAGITWRYAPRRGTYTQTLRLERP